MSGTVRKEGKGTIANGGRYHKGPMSAVMNMWEIITHSIISIMQKSFFFLHHSAHYSLNKWENYHRRRNIWQKAKGKESEIWMTPRAFDNTGAVRTHLEAAEWVRPGRVFIIGHNTNVLPCQLYHFTAPNGTSVNVRKIWYETKEVAVWGHSSFDVQLYGLNNTINWRIIYQAIALKSQRVKLMN